MTDSSHSLRCSVRRVVRGSLPRQRALLALGAAGLGLLVALSLLIPSSTSAQTPGEAPAPPTPAIYAVQAGETLSEIARKNGVSVEDLMRVNGIPNADAIYVGQRLRFPLEEAPVDATVHEVEPGEGLLQIARQYGVDVRAIMRANGIANPNGIVAGQELVIPDSILPPASSAPAASNSTSAPAETEAAEPLVYTVLPGDSASVIAKRYGVTLSDLLRYNGIANANLIRIGAKLVIPPSRNAAEPADAASSTRTDSSAGTDADANTADPTPMPPASETLTETPAEESAQPESAAVADGAGVDDTGQDNAALDDATTAVALVDAGIDAATLAALAVPLPERPANTLNREYTVVRGDTVPAIALRLGVDPDALRDLNSLVDDVHLVAGHTLLLPATDRDLRVVTAEEEYVVQSGDSLSAIAKRFDVTLGDLMSANRMSNPNLVSVGERLTIPGRAITGDGPLTRVGPARTGYYFYTVQSGDTLSELARSFDITKLALLKYNNLPNEETVYAGMEMRVPFGAPEIPRRLPPVPISGSRFLISLSRQQCWVFAGREVRFAWNCSTGIEDRRTKTGNFAVQSKIENAKSNVWRLDMPWWLGIYDVGRVENGIHGLPVSWATGEKIWTTLIGQPATFGCAMLDDPNAETLFDLAYIGMPVHIIQ